MTRNELAQTIFDCSHITGEFKLRSGIVSNEYFDKYQFESNPTILNEIVNHLIPIIPSDIELLAGLEMGGLAIVTALSLKTGIPAVFVRKKAKDYGTAKLAEGPDVEGKRIVVIEDVVTSGGQVVLSAGDLRRLGAAIDHVLCVIDREQGGREALRKDNLELLALFTISELKMAGSKS